MPYLQTAILADKFTGLSLLLMALWMVPNIVVTTTRPNDPATTTPQQLLLAPPEQWVAQRSVSQYLKVLQSVVSAEGSSNDETLDAIQAISQRAIGRRIIGDYVQMGLDDSSSMALVHGLWRATGQSARRSILCGSTLHKSAPWEQVGVFNDNMLQATTPDCVQSADREIAVLHIRRVEDAQALIAQVPIGGFIVVQEVGGNLKVLEKAVNNESQLRGNREEPTPIASKYKLRRLS